MTDLKKIGALKEVGDTLLPSQDADRKRARRSPEKRLMLAILQDAVDEYMKNALSQGRRRKRLFKETEEWIWSPDRSWLFSFENICEAFDLDPDNLRQGLERWKASRAQEVQGKKEK